MVSAPTPVPVTASRPLPFTWCALVMPKRTPRSRSKVSLTITMRASINTCLTGTSKVCTRRRISASLSAGVLHQQGVGALVDRQGAARRQHGILGAAWPWLDQFRQVRDLGVVDLHELGVDRRQLLHFFVRGQFRLLARGEFFGGPDDDDVVLTALVQALGAQHDVEGLIPGHVLQAQRQIAGDRIADHDVLAAGVRQQLQYRAHVDVLEVQGQPLAGVFLLVFLAAVRFVRRLDFDGVLVVGLVGQLLEIALRADHQARAALDPNRIDGLHRGCEIHDVVAAHEVLRHQRCRRSPRRSDCLPDAH